MYLEKLKNESDYKDNGVISFWNVNKSCEILFSVGRDLTYKRKYVTFCSKFKKIKGPQYSIKFKLLFILIASKPTRPLDDKSNIFSDY